MNIEITKEFLKDIDGYTFSIIPSIILNKQKDHNYNLFNIVFCWLFFYIKIEKIKFKIKKE